MKFQKALPVMTLFAAMACSTVDTTAPINAGAQISPKNVGLEDAASPRSGTVSLVKECSGFNGGPGSHCTIKESNLSEIELESTITYLNPPSVFTPAGSDVVLDLPGPGNNAAYGHCALNLATNQGVCTFSGGTGKFQWFNARLVVSDPFGMSWHLNGDYSFSK